MGYRGVGEGGGRLDVELRSVGLWLAILSLHGLGWGCTADDPLRGEFPDVGDASAETDVAGGWTYDLASLYESQRGCLLPACDEDAEFPSELDVSKNRSWTRRTERTTCGDLVQRSDARTREDAVFDGSLKFGSREGSCLYDEEGKRIGTVKYGTVALCIREKRNNSVESYRTEVTTFRNGVGRGKIRFYLRGVPQVAGGDCKVDWKVVYESE